MEGASDEENGVIPAECEDDGADEHDDKTGKHWDTVTDPNKLKLNLFDLKGKSGRLVPL